MDKLVRKLIDKTTSLPITGAVVKARPVHIGADGDILLDEVGDSSGVYATADEVPHATYKLIVNGADSLDEFTVESGRVRVVVADGTYIYPLIDRVLDSKLVLTSFLDDIATEPSSFTLVSAIAAASGAKPRTLVFDADCSLETGVTVSEGDLVIDLNGYTLNLANFSASITSSTHRIRVLNGKINVSSTSCKIQGAGTNFIGVQFSGTTTLFAQADADMAFDACDGLSALPGANLPGVHAAVSGGSHGFGTAAQLKLTDPGSNSGSMRLSRLQALIDTWYAKITGIFNDACTWLTSEKRGILDEWANLPSSYRAELAGIKSFQKEGSVETLAYISTTRDEFGAGLKLGLQIVRPAGIGSPFLRGVMKFGYSGSGTSISENVPYSSMTATGQALTTSEWEAFSWYGDSVDVCFVAAYRINSYGERKNLRFKPTIVEVKDSGSGGIWIVCYNSSPSESGVDIPSGSPFYVEFDILNDSAAGTTVTVISR